MNYLDLTLETPAQNLALDEALLLEADRCVGPACLRLWESPTWCVVLGRNCRLAEDVWQRRCRHDGVPILRRCTGGGTVVLGPGCLNLALVLPRRQPAAVPNLPAAADCLLTRLAEAVRTAAGRAVAGSVCSDIGPTLAGTSDLALAGRKFCGNAQRWLARCFLHQSSILYAFDLERVGWYLKEPQRQPAYRQGRDHRSFLTNLPVAPAALRQSLQAVWSAWEPLEQWPASLTDELAQRKYASWSWTSRR